MHLGTNTVDKSRGLVLALNESDHSLDLGVVRVKVVVVDVQLGGAISSASGLEGDGDE